ncbi:MAG TPA: phosphoglycolate phosphatase [Noviherbaspirillum sp.]
MNASERSLLTGIRAAIVDLDGTMVHTAPDFKVAVNRMREELGLAPLDIETITDFVGQGTENLMRRVLAVDYAPADVEAHFPRAIETYMRHYRPINGVYSTVYPGVHDGLAALRSKGLRLACVTNKPAGFARELLEKMDLAGYFELLYGGDSLPKKKPDPYPMLKVCEDFQLAPTQVVAIGDSSNDAKAARAAGCRVLNVPYGYNHGEPIHAVDSDGIVPTLLDAAHLISA